MDADSVSGDATHDGELVVHTVDQARAITATDEEVFAAGPQEAAAGLAAHGAFEVFGFNDGDTTRPDRDVVDVGAGS